MDCELDMVSSVSGLPYFQVGDTGLNMDQPDQQQGCLEQLVRQVIIKKL